MSPHHDSPKKNRFIGSVQSGLKVAQAARLHDIPQSTASSIWHKFKDTGSTHVRPQTGRPAKVTPHLTREIVHKSKKNCRLPLRDLANTLATNLSTSTVCNVLAGEGRHRRKARKAIFLNKAHRMARRAWAVRNKHMTHADWRHVIWSDESYFYLGGNRGTVYVTRSAAEAYDEDCLIPTFLQSPIRLMVWGCIMEGRKGPLVILDYPGGKGGGMTAGRYQNQVLDGPLHDFYQQMSEERGIVVFQEDGASCHRAKSTKAWLKRNSVISFAHPAKSPDLLLIESVWHIMKSKIRAQTHLPTSLKGLKVAVLKAWDDITPDEINAHVKHMEDRVKAVLAAKGGHTRF
jgi:transposase